MREAISCYWLSYKKIEQKRSEVFVQCATLKCGLMHSRMD